MNKSGRVMRIDKDLAKTIIDHKEFIKKTQGITVSDAMASKSWLTMIREARNKPPKDFFGLR